MLTDAEIEEVVAWGTHRDALGPETDRGTARRLSEEVLASDTDEGLVINGRFRLSSGIDCPVFGTATPQRGVDVWSEDALIRWDWRPPEIYQGFDAKGARVRIEPDYAPTTGASSAT